MSLRPSLIHELQPIPVCMAKSVAPSKIHLGKPLTMTYDNNNLVQCYGIATIPAVLNTYILHA